MKTRTLAGLAVLALLPALLLTLAVSAQGSEPVSQPAPAGSHASLGRAQLGLEEKPRENAAGAASAPAEGLGEPGFNYRPVRTYGIKGEPYFDTPYYLNDPHGMFMDGSDNLYVVEETGNRLLKYGPAGNLLLKIGKAGVILPLRRPWDVALDGSGNIWVVDSDGVHQFAPDGLLLQDVSDSGEPTGFSQLEGVAFDSQGRLYLADKDNERVLVYEIVSDTLVYSTTIGATGVPGGDDGHFNQPVSLAIDSSDRLYVADRDNKRVQRCTHAVSWACTTFYTVTDTSQGLSVGVDNSDHVYISHPSNCQVVKCDSAGSCAVLISTNPLGSSDVAVDSAGNVFLSFAESLFGTGDYTIRKYDSSGAPLGVFAGVSGVPYTTDDEHFNAPEGIVIDSHGDIAVVAGNQLIKMEPDGDRIWAWGVPGVAGWPADGLMLLPGDVEVDSDGTYYVTDLLHVTIIRSNGTYSATLGHGCCTGPYALWFNRGVAVDPESGKIYASSSFNHVVHVYDASLNYLTDLGEEGVAGSDNAHFSNPANVYIDQAGNIYVADTDNCRVQKFNRQRVYQKTFGITGQCGESFDKLESVDDVAVDSQGRVFVTFWGYVRVYDQAGNYLTNVGGEAGGYGGRLSVDVDSAGNVYVADSFNHIIQVFAPGVPNWRQVNINGFGDRWGSLVGGLVDFNGQLYAGISSGDGARIWRQSGTSWTAVVTDGFGSADNWAIDHLYPFDGQLYAGTVNDLGGGEVWRSNNGLDWTNVATHGFGDPTNGEIMHFTEFNSAIYAGTWSYTTTRGAEIWRSTTGNAGDWSRVVANGFNDDANNGAVVSFEPYNGYLYAGTLSSTGGEVWRSSTGNTGSWTQVNADGFGDAGNAGVSALSAFGDYLYAATHHNAGVGSEVLRCQACDGTDWEQVVDNGFGTTGRRRTPALEVVGGALYLAIGDRESETSLGVWRTTNGTDWEQVGFGGFGDASNYTTYFDNAMTAFHNSLYIGTSNSSNGGEVWQFFPRQIFLPLVVRNH
jgi:hypothetical protein